MNDLFSEPTTPIEFVMQGVTKEGDMLLPDNAPFELVMKYLEECKTLLVGSDTKQVCGFPKIQEGSIKLVFSASTSLLSSFYADMNLANRQDFTCMDPARLRILSVWNKRSAKNDKVTFKIPVSEREVLSISNKTRLDIPEENFWTEEEDVLDGVVMNAGGGKPNIHFLPDGQKRSITVSTTQEQLIDNPCLYKKVRIHVKYQVNRYTKECANYELLEFVPESVAFDENDPVWLNLLAEGSKAWADVKDPVAWVRELREGE